MKAKKSGKFGKLLLLKKKKFSRMLRNV